MIKYIAIVSIVMLSSCYFPSVEEVRKPEVIFDTWQEAAIWIDENITYTPDLDTHGQREYWQAPQETLDRGTGDCEDFAILLGYYADALGDDVKIVIVYDHEKVITHCVVEINGVLIAAQSGSRFILEDTWKVILTMDFKDAIAWCYYGYGSRSVSISPI
jgi:hypothetical protein